MSTFPPIRTRVAGISFDNPNGSSRQAIARMVKKGDALVLRREPENPHDSNAIAVDWAKMEGRSFQLGYLPSGTALLLAPLLDKGYPLRAVVLQKIQGRDKQVGLKIEISS